MSDELELVAVLAEIRRGNREAFGVIVRAYGLPLRSYLAAHLHHTDDVDDLAQDVLLAALARLDDFRPGESFWAWLRGIARNKVFNHYRSASRRNSTLARFRERVARVVETDLDRAAENDRADAIERLLFCIGHLPERLRRVVRAGLDGDRPTVLAAELAVAVGTVYNLHYRANQLLRECMQKGLS
ncbi:MAG: sigma-70 family RNA polymerase sigma factor [Gemmataceae bacterium]